VQDFCESVLEIPVSKHGARIARECIKAMFPFAEQEPDEAKEVMAPGRLWSPGSPLLQLPRDRSYIAAARHHAGAVRLSEAGAPGVGSGAVSH
jgi:hypothetical protein